MPLDPAPHPPVVRATDIKFIMLDGPNEIPCFVLHSVISYLAGREVPVDELLREFDRNKDRLFAFARKKHDAGHQYPVVGLMDVLGR